MKHKIDTLSAVAFFLQEPAAEDRITPPVAEQEKILRERAERLGLQLLDSPILGARSSWAPGRRGFRDLISDVEAGRKNAILVWDLRQLAANATDAASLLWLVKLLQLKTVYTRDEVLRNTRGKRLDLMLRIAAAGCLDRAPFEKVVTDFANDLAG